MVSHRCINTVQHELNIAGLNFFNVQLGEVDIREPVTELQLVQIKLALRKTGLELIDDQRAKLIQQIKAIIIELIHYEDDLPKIPIATLISQKLHDNYNHLSKLFCDTEGITIEHFLILHKIEKAKELILYNELTLTDIAYKLNYSSVAHLSNQFKKVTGLTPSFFKNLKGKRKQLPIQL